MTIVVDKTKYSCSIFDFVDYRSFLGFLFELIKNKKPKYSYSDFSVDLGFSNTNFSYLLVTGKRNISEESGNIIAKKLKFNARETKYLLYCIHYQHHPSLEKRTYYYDKIIELRLKYGGGDFNDLQVEYLSKWYHQVILELIIVQPEMTNSKKIAELLRPNIRPLEAEKSLQVLEKLKFIKFNKMSKKYIINHSQIRIDLVDNGLMVKKYQSAMLDVAKSNLFDIREKDREYTSLTFRTSHKKFQEMKSKISDFMEKLFLEEEDPEDAEVLYHLNVNLFPVTDSLKLTDPKKKNEP